jgi:hypothetical protein
MSARRVVDSGDNGSSRGDEEEDGDGVGDSGFGMMMRCVSDDSRLIMRQFDSDISARVAVDCSTVSCLLF